jgi:hypothetical protein
MPKIPCKVGADPAGGFWHADKPAYKLEHDL